ncbi:orexigenic neuropeptide QRFP [Amazona ochrocephala]
MRAPYSLSCLFLLSLGSCLPPGQPQEPGPRGEWTLLGPSGRAGAEDAGPWRRKGPGSGRAGSAAPSWSGTLGSLAGELSGCSRRKGGFAFRFGR